jgi:regulator of replication initiation timing
MKGLGERFGDLNDEQINNFGSQNNQGKKSEKMIAPEEHFKDIDGLKKKLEDLIDKKKELILEQDKSVKNIEVQMSETEKKASELNQEIISYEKLLATKKAEFNRYQEELKLKKISKEKIMAEYKYAVREQQDSMRHIVDVYQKGFEGLGKINGKSAEEISGEIKEIKEKKSSLPRIAVATGIALVISGVTLGIAYFNPDVYQKLMQKLTAKNAQTIEAKVNSADLNASQPQTMQAQPEISYANAGIDGIEINSQGEIVYVGDNAKSILEQINTDYMNKKYSDVFQSNLAEKITKEMDKGEAFAFSIKSGNKAKAYKCQIKSDVSNQGNHIIFIH